MGQPRQGTQRRVLTHRPHQKTPPPPPPYGTMSSIARHAQRSDSRSIHATNEIQRPDPDRQQVT